MQMSQRQWRTLSLVERIARGEITISEAGASLGRSERQMQRICRRVSERGPEGLVHGNKRRPPKHKVGDEARRRFCERSTRGAYGTLQDRLVSELRLAGASTPGQANQVLRAYRPQCNEIFAVPAAELQPAWRSPFPTM